MLLDNLATHSFSAALQRTFDGKHPCSLCKVIAAAKKAEKKTKADTKLQKFEGLTQPIAIAPSPPASYPLVEALEINPEAFPHSPPTPPPRAT